MLLDVGRTFQMFFLVWPDEEGVVHTFQPSRRFALKTVCGFLYEIFPKNVCYRERES